MTLRDWKEVLMPSEMEALEDYGYTMEQDGDREIDRGDIFEIIVEWNGGLATAYHIKSIIHRVYGIRL